MDRQQYFKNKLVEHTDLNGLQDNVETMERDLVLEHLGVGVISGLVVTEAGTPGISALVSAGVARDSTGARVAVDGPTAVNLTVDSNAASTAVGPGNERWLLIALRTKRTEQDPFNDPIGGSGYFTQRESFEILVVSGVEAAIGASVPPALPTGNPVLLAGVVRKSTTLQFNTRDFYVPDRPLRSIPAIVGDSTKRLFEFSSTQPPSMRVAITAGRAVIDETEVVTVGPQNTATITAPVLKPRIDLVYVNALGVIGVRTGVEATVPDRPSTAGVLPIAFVSLDVGQAAIEASHLSDARPWMRAITAVARVHSITAGGGETVIGLPFTYTVGANAIEVMKNGSVLRPDQFTENAVNQVTLGAALIAGDRLVVRAEMSAPLGTPASHATSHAAGGADALSGLALTQVTDDLSGLLVGGDVLFTPQADATGKQITVSAIAAVVIAKKRLAIVQTTIDEAQLSPAGVYASSTHYYVYCFDNGGALAFQISTTAPDANLVWKAGGTTHRYVGTFRTGGDGKVLPFRAKGGAYTFRTSGRSTLLDFTEIGIASATVFTDAFVSEWLPPHARIAKLLVKVQPGNGLDRTLTLRTNGDANDGVVWPTHGGSAAEVECLSIEIETDATQVFEYKLSAAVSSLEFVVMGFREG